MQILNEKKNAIIWKFSKCLILDKKIRQKNLTSQHFKFVRRYVCTFQLQLNPIFEEGK